MADGPQFLRVEQKGSIYEVSFLVSEVDEAVEDEFRSMSSLLFFQTRSHLQIDFHRLDSVPFPFLLRTLQLAKDLRSKKRVLVVVGLPYSQFHYLQRFSLKDLFFENEEGLFRSIIDSDHSTAVSPS